MKCIFIIQFNDKAPAEVRDDKQEVRDIFLNRIPGSNVNGRIEWHSILPSGVMWIVNTIGEGEVRPEGDTSPGSEEYMNEVSAFVGRELNGFVAVNNQNKTEEDPGNWIFFEPDGTTKHSGVFPPRLAKWARVPLNELIACFVPVGIPERGEDNNPYAIIPFGLLPKDSELKIGENNGHWVTKEPKQGEKEENEVREFISTIGSTIVFAENFRKGKNGIGMAGGEGGHKIG